MNPGGAVAAIFSVLFAVGAAVAPSPARGGERPFGEIAAVRYAGAADEAVFKIGDDRVPAAALAEFLARYSSKSADDFLERELAVRDVLARGEANGWPDDARRQVRLLYLYALGEHFFDEGSRDVVLVSADDIRSALPARMVMGRFELLVFGSEAEARKALESVRTAEEFDKYAREHPEKRKALDELTPASGFFHPFDDAALFNRADGEVAGYMETGIGSAVVLVRSVRTMSESEVAEYVATMRGNLFENKRDAYFRESRQRHAASIDREAIRDFSVRELRKEIGPGMDREFCRVAGIGVRFGDFGAILDAPLSKTLKEGDTDHLAELYTKACEKVVQNVSDGLTAIENGRLAPGGQWDKWFDERKRRVYYLRGILDFLGDDWAATDKDARKYYKEHRAKKYDVPESVRALYIFVSDESRAREVVERLAKGEPFEKVAERYSEFQKHSGHARKSDVVRIQRGSDIHASIHEEIFGKRLGPGDVTKAIRTPVGFHIFKIVEKAPAKVVPFEAVASGIRTDLNIERFEAGRKKYVRELRKKYAVTRFEDALKAVESRLRGGKKTTPVDSGEKSGKPKTPHDAVGKAGTH